MAFIQRRDIPDRIEYAAERKEMMIALRRAMQRIIKQRILSGASVIGGNEAGGGGGNTAPQGIGARHSGSVRDDGGRRNSAAQPTTDILSHLQELKAKEKHVLGRGSRDTQQQSSSLGPNNAASNAAGQSPGGNQPTSAEEIKSRQERLAREEKLANIYRDQLTSRMQEIDDNAVDLGAQKAIMTRFERQLLGSSSPRELEQLELERVNGIRSLIGLPALPPPSLATGAAGSGSVRQSRPGTPLYMSSSPSHIPPSHHPTRRSGPDPHRRTTSFGEYHSSPGVAHSGNHLRAHNPGMHQSSGLAHNGTTASRAAHRNYANDDGDDDEVQDMDLDLEEGELSEEGELAE
ncbi:hypothetical protein BX070DRAFT_235853 [Coemansia spiralis]|nr:hypothetical protein BX070DRAFT_235853 [Coemansia spiralis]KAJ1990899.1 hypothetical protein EDC05_003749 [Coemansia umbellata]